MDFKDIFLMDFEDIFLMDFIYDHFDNLWKMG
jgi:hypothetical protein